MSSKSPSPPLDNDRLLMSPPSSISSPILVCGARCRHGCRHCGFPKVPSPPPRPMKSDFGRGVAVIKNDWPKDQAAQWNMKLEMIMNWKSDVQKQLAHLDLESIRQIVWPILARKKPVKPTIPSIVQPIQHMQPVNKIVESSPKPVNQISQSLSRPENQVFQSTIQPIKRKQTDTQDQQHPPVECKMQKVELDRNQDEMMDYDM
ncbi:uncharacterized protein L201_001926 [Kwoniella dendrophila CBS 6074]|uniref:Uncharacterized protein n=1 Tax=Kwoniella dendrophila CBS 6074 TaxID=1295534 RepID=A0AAX4JNS0_9TREE